MFINVMLDQNPQLIEWALYAHDRCGLPPNTYVIDLDAVRQNARSLSKEAARTGMNLYMMAKQLGHNPLVCSAITECGIRKAVAVSMDAARIMYYNGIRIGHLGHLVQIPEGEVDEALDMSPEVITVFDYENAEKISRHAGRKKIRQDILLRITAADDFVYDQQPGGIPLEKLPETIERINSLDGVRIVGFTEFPCYMMDWNRRLIKATSNYHNLLTASQIGAECGLEIRHVNAPGGNACSLIESAVKDGITHFEPGHALTGTTYQNSVNAGSVEKPAMVYLSEISHHWNGSSFVFGGGFYGRAKIYSALVGSHDQYRRVEAVAPSPGTIDYYAELHCADPVGTGVVYAFRTQLFITHSNLAVVEGLSSGRPILAGLHNQRGDRIK